MARVSILGAGYVGLVTGAGLAELGHDVVCVESAPERLAVLERGDISIHEPGLSTLIDRHRASGRLRFTGEYARAIPAAEFVFIAVNTPAGPDGAADTTYVFAAVGSMLEHGHAGQIIVTKSTVPVGTGDAIADMVAAAGLRGIDVVSNPEFLREGAAIKDFLAPDRIVVGAESTTAAGRVARLYSLDTPVVICGRRSAELAKYAANALLATRISFMNEISAICEAADADIGDVARVVGFDRRIGSSYLDAGLGWGGSCFPKDVRALAATAANHGVRTLLLEAAFRVNARQRERMFERLRAALERPHGATPTVAVLGLAFKPNTDDIRESPALDIIGRLVEEGIRVRAHDPVAIDNARRALPNITYCDDPYEAARGGDALLLATEWREYAKLNWQRMRSLMRGRTVVDGRNLLNGSRLTELGFRYLSVGRQPSADGNAMLFDVGVSAAGGL